MRNLLDTYFQSIRLTKGPLYVEFFTYAFRAKGAANFRLRRVRSVYARADGISLIARRSPPIRFDTWSRDASSLAIAYVTINYNALKHTDQNARITSSEK